MQIPIQSDDKVDVYVYIYNPLLNIFFSFKTSTCIYLNFIDFNENTMKIDKKRCLTVCLHLCDNNNLSIFFNVI